MKGYFPSNQHEESISCNLSVYESLIRHAFHTKRSIRLKENLPDLFVNL